LLIVERERERERGYLVRKIKGMHVCKERILPIRVYT